MNLLLPGVYVAADSTVHRLDPRVKMAAAMIFTVLPFAAPGRLGNLILSGSVLGLVFLSRVPVLALLRTLTTVLWLGLYMFAFAAVSTAGPAIVTWRSVSITSTGLLTGATQIYRLCMLVTIASLMSYTTSPMQLAHGLEALLRPMAKAGLPVRELTLVLTIALRFVPTLDREVAKIAKAQQARGADRGNAPWHRIRSWVPMFVPVFVSAFRRAEHLAIAMETRGFRGVKNRTRLYQLQLNRRDLFASLIVLIVVLVVLGASYLAPS